METKVLLPITFDNVRDKNIEQLRVLNRAIFPINYPERMYQDVLACGEVTHLAYHNDVLIGAIACRLEKIPGVSMSLWVVLSFNPRVSVSVIQH